MKFEALLVTAKRPLVSDRGHPFTIQRGVVGIVEKCIHNTANISTTLLVHFEWGSRFTVSKILSIRSVKILDS